jgi:ribosomal protein L37AE/L43A
MSDIAIVKPVERKMYEITCPYCLESEIAEENYKGIWCCTNCEELFAVDGNVENEDVKYFVSSIQVN